MRRDIVHEGSGQLTYEIREVVAVANELKALGVDITWENIGDPIEKGEAMPEWIKEIVTKLVSEDKTYGYVSTQGVPETRQFLAKHVNKRGGCQVTEDDIIFFNGESTSLGFLSSCWQNSSKVSHKSDCSNKERSNEK